MYNRVCKLFLFALFFLTKISPVASQEVLTLDVCRQRALETNHQVQINKESLEASKDLHRATIANFFPKLSAMGGYLWNQKTFHLLADEKELSIGTVDAHGHFTPSAALLTSIASNPLFAAMLQNPAALQSMMGVIQNTIPAAYKSIYDEFTLDDHNIFIGQIGLTQPIFLGTKLIQLNKMAKISVNIAEIRSKSSNESLLIAVEEAYWRVVSVKHKLALAQQYHSLLETLYANMSASVEAGMRTKADLLQVNIKLNEAFINLGQAEDGLVLAKMALCQLVGMDINSDIDVSEEGFDQIDLVDIAETEDAGVSQRDEIHLLEQMQALSRSGVKMAASSFMPNIVATANYIATSPSAFNGIRTNMEGFFNVGVVMNVPIAHADDFFKYKAAKHQEKIAALQLEEAREKVQLQASQSKNKLRNAQRTLLRSKTSKESAEENLRLAQASFDEQMISSSDLLAAQTAWEKACSDYIDTAVEVRLDYLNYLKNTGNFAY